MRFIAEWPATEGKRRRASSELSQWKTNNLRESNADDDLGAIQGIVVDSYNRVHHVRHWNVSSILERGLPMICHII